MKRITLIFLLVPMLCFSQDIHFSDILHNKIFINPSVSSLPTEINNTGIIYRCQGKSITVPYKTYGLWLEKKLNLKFLQNDKAGYALIASNDIAGDGNLQKVRILLSGSYAKTLMDKKLVVALGYGIGITNQSIDFSKLTFATQWNGNFFDPAAAQHEPYANSSIFYLDMYAGLSAFYSASDKLRFEGGIATDHLKEPKETFYTSKNQLGRKVSVFVSSRIINEQLQFTPGAIFLTQSKNSEILFGSDILYHISDFTIGGGLWYRWRSDIIPSLRIAKQRLEFTISYDTNIGIMHPASLYRGGMELSVRISLDKKKVNKYDCDEMEF